MSVAGYSAARPGPSLLRTAWLLVAGWLVAAAVLLALYIVAILLGVLGSNPGPSQKGILNESPFPDNGLWSLAANVSVLALGLLVATRAVAGELRRSFDAVSEGRLALVLLFTGWIPLLAPSRGAPLVGFVIAVWLVRRWVTRGEDQRTPLRVAITVGVVLALTAGSYGFLHPVWVESAWAFVSNPASHARSLEVQLHNVSRLPVTIEALDAGPLAARPFAGSRWEHRPVAGVRIAPGATGAFTFALPRGGCTTFFPDASVRYRVAGLTFKAPLVLAPSGVHHCG